MSARTELSRIFRDIFVNGIVSSSLIPDKWRWKFLRSFGYNLESCRIAPKVFIGSGSLTVGKNSMINREAFLDPSAAISIGQNSRIGMRSTLITASHVIGATQETRTERQPGADIRAPIHIGDNVWIGAGVTILPGINIEPGCVVAAGAVVTRSCAANGLYGGVPARRIRDLPV